jgi:hypothetical protein
LYQILRLNFEKTGIYALRFMFYEVAHRLYFPLIGENLAVVSYPLFGFDLFFRHPIAPSVWQEVQSLGEKVYLPAKRFLQSECLLKRDVFLNSSVAIPSKSWYNRSA